MEWWLGVLGVGYDDSYDDIINRGLEHRYVHVTESKSRNFSQECSYPKFNIFIINYDE